MGLMSKIFNNTRKPEGFIGKMMAKGMNTGSHSKIADWGFKHIKTYGNENAIDLGCGGGANVARLLVKLPAGNVTGIDYSEVSVDVSRKLNDASIKGGRCTILQANVAAIPLPDASFDIATAFETIYFWPDLVNSFREVYRILKPGGTFLITNESNGKNQKSLKWTEVIEGMTVYTGEQLNELLTQAGFKDVVVDDDNKKDRLCVVAKKAPASN